VDTPGKQPDRNDAAWKLAEASLDTVRGDLDAIGRAFDEIKPNTRTLARAYALCLNTPPFSQTEATRLILHTLQYALAEKTADKLNALTKALVFLTLALLLFGVFDIYLRMRGCG
jgi:hypothetical protein